uniref:FBD domain-containing protein n=1 Tax=Oryza punctata TaxID=4537 RepID=A0A0E0KNN7_ORYPU
MPGGDWYWEYLRWCRIERCPMMKTVFPPNANGFAPLETIWVSDLLMAHCIWSIGYSRGAHSSFRKLRQLHLRNCPRLCFVLPVWASSFLSLETLHVIHFSDLPCIFVPDGEYAKQITVKGVTFPKLATIHLHNLMMLQQICYAILRELPTVAACGPKPSVQIEKDVWDALEWDGVEAGHHPSLFKKPIYSLY